MQDADEKLTQDAAAPLPSDPEPSPRQFARERWQIWSLQVAIGMDPCYRTERRYGCAAQDCPYRMRCIG